MRNHTVTSASRFRVAKARRLVRRRIIISPTLQFRRLIPIGVFAVIQVLLLSAFLFYPFHRDASRDPNPAFRTIMSQDIVNFYVRFWPIFILSATLAAIYTLIVSNRLAGPLFKLRRQLLKMADGKFESVRFRKRDELREFEDVVNRLAKKMKSLSDSYVRQISHIEKRLTWLKACVERQGLPAEKIQSELEALLKEISNTRPG